MQGCIQDFAQGGAKFAHTRGGQALHAVHYNIYSKISRKGANIQQGGGGGGGALKINPAMYFLIALLYLVICLFFFIT